MAATTTNKLPLIITEPYNTPRTTTGATAGGEDAVGDAPATTVRRTRPTATLPTVINMFINKERTGLVHIIVKVIHLHLGCGNGIQNNGEKKMVNFFITRLKVKTMMLSTLLDQAANTRTATAVHLTARDSVQMTRSGIWMQHPLYPALPLRTVHMLLPALAGKTLTAVGTLGSRSSAQLRAAGCSRCNAKFTTIKINKRKHIKSKLGGDTKKKRLTEKEKKQDNSTNRTRRNN